MKKPISISELAVSIAATAFNSTISAAEALEILDIASAMVRIEAARDMLRSQPQRA